tara:strand:- start:207 stop:446 length:240 start_codon:yes stop_codon:yes gene_type:complete
MLKKNKDVKMYYGGGMTDARNRSQMYMMEGGKISKNEHTTLEKHKAHHSKEHIGSMEKDMMKGDSFKESHSKALKKVGK